MFLFWISKVFALDCRGLDETICKGTSGCMWTEPGCVEGSGSAFANYIDNIYTHYALPAGLALGVGMIVYAGILYINSGGDPQKVSTAKEVIVSTILGVLVLLLAGLILRTLTP